MGQLGSRAIDRISGRAWEGLREKFLTISHHILGVSPDTFAELTTIYVKFTLTSQNTSPVYAAVWLKNSRSLTCGFSLPEDFNDAALGPPPEGMKYKGLTRYFTITPEDEIPAKCGEWSEIAYRLVASHS